MKKSTSASHIKKNNDRKRKFSDHTTAVELQQNQKQQQKLKQQQRPPKKFKTTTTTTTTPTSTTTPTTSTTQKNTKYNQQLFHLSQPSSLEREGDSFSTKKFIEKKKQKNKQLSSSQPSLEGNGDCLDDSFTTTKKLTEEEKKKLTSSKPLEGDCLDDSFNIITTSEEPRKLTEEEKKQKKKLKRKIQHQKFKNERKWTDVQFESPTAQQSFFWLRLAESLNKEITPLELADAIEPSCFVRPSGEKWDITQLPNFLKGGLADLQRPNTTAKHPFVIVFTGSTTRVIEIFKILCSLGSKVRVGQFFAKHKTLQEQQQMLEKTPYHIVVGTPARLKDLMDSDSLSVETCSMVVIDMSMDAKSFTVLDMKDTKVPFFRLYQRYLHSPVKQGKTKIVLF